MSVSLSPPKVPSMTVTPTAIAYMKKMMKKNPQAVGIKLALKNTGCSGKSYVISIIESVLAQDYSFALTENLFLYIDSESYPLLTGICIDYVREGLNGKFVFNNPQSKAACGCGESFYV